MDSALKQVREALKEMDKQLPPSGEKDSIYLDIRKTMIELSDKLNKLETRLGTE